MIDAGSDIWVAVNVLDNAAHGCGRPQSGSAGTSLQWDADEARSAAEAVIAAVSCNRPGMAMEALCILRNAV